MLARCLELKASEKLNKISPHRIYPGAAQQASKSETARPDLHRVPRKPVATTPDCIETPAYHHKESSSTVKDADLPTFTMNRNTVFLTGPKYGVEIVRRTTKTGERLDTPETYYESTGESESNYSMLKTPPAQVSTSPHWNAWQVSSGSDLAPQEPLSGHSIETRITSSLYPSSTQVFSTPASSSSGTGGHSYQGSDDHSLSTSATDCSPGPQTGRCEYEVPDAASHSSSTVANLTTDDPHDLQRPESALFWTRAGRRKLDASTDSGNPAALDGLGYTGRAKGNLLALELQDKTEKYATARDGLGGLARLTLGRQFSLRTAEAQAIPLSLHVEADQAEAELYPGTVTRVGCLVTVSVPRESFASRKYVCTQSDRDYANAATQSLKERAKLSGTKIPSTYLKGLRLQATHSYATRPSSNLQRTQRNSLSLEPEQDLAAAMPIAWISAAVYLTATHLIVCERAGMNGSLRPREMLALDNILTARLLPHGPSESLCVELDVTDGNTNQCSCCPDTPRSSPRTIWLASAKSRTTRDWAAALHDGSLQFPLAPIELAVSEHHSVSVNSGRSSEEPQTPKSSTFTLGPAYESSQTEANALRPSLSLAICVPEGIPSRALFPLLGRLGPLDRVAVLQYGKNASNHVPAILHSAAWPGWSSLISGSKRSPGSKRERSLDVCPNQECYDLKSVLHLAQEVLTADRRGALASVILIGAGPCELARVPPALELLEIPVNTIGVGASHNGDLLSRLAGSLGGDYINAQDVNDLEDVLVNLVESERSTTHRDVVAVLRPRGGTLHRVRGYDSAPSSQTHAASVDSEISTTRELLLMNSDATTATVQLGRMRAGEDRQLLVEIDLDPQRCKRTKLQQRFLDVAVDGEPIASSGRRVRNSDSAKALLKHSDSMVRPQGDQLGQTLVVSSPASAGCAAAAPSTPQEGRLQLNITEHTSCNAVRRGLTLAVAETLENALLALDARGAAAVDALLTISAADLEAVHARFELCGLAVLRAAKAQDVGAGAESIHSARISAISSQWLPSGEVLTKTLLLCDAMAKSLSELRTKVVKYQVGRQEIKAAILQLIWTLRGGRAFGRRTLVESAFFDQQAINVV